MIKNLTQSVPAQQLSPMAGKHIKLFQFKTRIHTSLLLPFRKPLAGPVVMVVQGFLGEDMREKERNEMALCQLATVRDMQLLLWVALGYFELHGSESAESCRTSSADGGPTSKARNTLPTLRVETCPPVHFNHWPRECHWIPGSFWGLPQGPLDQTPGAWLIQEGGANALACLPASPGCLHQRYPHCGCRSLVADNSELAYSTRRGRRSRGWRCSF